jgi:hypothetical protein
MNQTVKFGMLATILITSTSRQFLIYLALLEKVELVVTTCLAVSKSMNIMTMLRMH